MQMELLGYSLVFAIIVLAGMIVVRYHAKHLIVKKYHIQNQKLKADCKICFVSDFHYMHFFSDQHYIRMINKINQCQPDIVIFGGDYLHRRKDAVQKNAERFISLLSSTKASYKIGILGNHDKDNFSDLVWKQIFEEQDIVLLKNEEKKISHFGLQIIGVDDYKRGQAEVKQMLTDDFQLLLTHNPDFIETVDASQFDLVLSGHLHGGQATIGFNQYPFLRLFKLSQYGLKYRYGNVGNEQYQHISTSGVGAHFGIRFCVYPEIVCISLEKKEPLI